MYEVTDDYGTWQVTEGDGFISKINIVPTQKYKDENPQEFLPKQLSQLELLQMAVDDLIFGGGL